MFVVNCCAVIGNLKVFDIDTKLDFKFVEIIMREVMWENEVQGTI